MIELCNTHIKRFNFPIAVTLRIISVFWLVLIPFSIGNVFAAFKPQDILGVPKLARKIARDSLGGNELFSQLGGIEWTKIGGKKVLVGVDPNWRKLVFMVSQYSSTMGQDSLVCYGGFNDGSLYTPIAVTSDTTGKYFVADEDSNHIVGLTFHLPDQDDPYFSFDRIITSGGGKNFNRPKDVKLYQDTLYILDSGNHRIVVCTPEGNYISEFGSEGQGTSQFLYPTGIAVSDSDVYVSDMGNHRVVRLGKSSGGQLQWLSSFDVGAYAPIGNGFVSTYLQGIAVDSHGLVYVLDSPSSRIIELSHDLSDTVKSFGNYGTGLGQFVYPRCIKTFADTGKLLVSEMWDEETGISAWRLTVKAYDAWVETPTQGQFFPAAGENAKIHFKVDGLANVHIYIINNVRSCDTIRTLTLNNVPAGVDTSVTWNGKSDLGRLFVPGGCSIKIHPEDAFPGGHYESEDTTVGVQIGGTYVANDPNIGGVWGGNSVHVLNNNCIVPTGDTLQIQPGAKVYFVPGPFCCTWSSLFIGGSVNADGALFTSYTRPGEANPGDWVGIFIGDSTGNCQPQDPSTEFQNSIIEYAGLPISQCSLPGHPQRGTPKVNPQDHCYPPGPISPTDTGSAVWNYRAPIFLKDTIRYSGNYGFYSWPRAYASIESCTFFNNNNYPLRLGANGLSKLTGNVFQSNGSGSKDAILTAADTVKTSGTWTYQGVPLRVYQTDEKIWVLRDPPPDTFEVVDSTIYVTGCVGGPQDTLTVGPGCFTDFKNGFGGINTGMYGRGTLVADGTNGAITFRGSAWGGLAFVGADSNASLLNSCSIRGTSFAGVYVQNPNNAVRVRNCTFDTMAHHGVYAVAGKPTVDGCTFKNIGMYPVYTSAAGLGKVRSNGFSQNTNDSTNMIVGYADTIKQDTTWQNQGVPYVLQFDSLHQKLVVSGQDGSDGVTTLTIDPGVTLKFRDIGASQDCNRQMEVGTIGQPGALHVAGTGSPDTFCAFNANQPWGGLLFGSGCDSALTLLDNVKLKNGSYKGLAVITTQSSSPTFKNCEVKDQGIGFKFSGSCPVLMYNTITGNDTGVYCINGTIPTIDSNTIAGNHQFGMLNSDQNQTVTATYNWWGHESGPLDDSQGSPDYNPCGQGNKVSDYVSYRPWLPDPGYLAMYSFSPGSGEYNNSQKYVKDWSGKLHAVYRSGNSIFYSYSSDYGSTWTERKQIGEGVYPAIAHDEQDSLHACWIKQADPGTCWIDTLARIYYSYKDSDGNWTPPCTLAAENSYYSPQILYSPPALDVLSDTVRIVYERLQAAHTMFSWNTHWKIVFGTFPVHNPQAVQWQTLDSLNLYLPALSTPIAPSINVDFNGLSHVVWQKEGVVYYREQLQDTIWDSKKSLSYDVGYSASCPSSNLYGSRLSVVWEEAPNFGNSYSTIHYRGRWLGEDWDPEQTLGSSTTHSYRPVVDANAVVSWCEGTDSTDIYYSKWNGTSWSTPTNVSNTSARSYDPHLMATQFIEWNDYEFLWTEGDSAPYHVTYLDHMSPWMSNPDSFWMSPWYSADVGRNNLSPFTTEREGYISYGPSREKTIDYASQTLVKGGVDAVSKGQTSESKGQTSESKGQTSESKGLAYQFIRLDTTFCYRFELVGYFEKKDHSPSTDAVSGNDFGTTEAQGEDKIDQDVLLNGQKVGEMELIPGQPDTFSFVIPKAIYRGGFFDLTLDKKSGKFSCLSELALYRWKEKGGESVSESHGAPQSFENVGLLPKVYELSQSSPNPARDKVMFRYALPKASQVDLSIYNISGQLVQKLVNDSQKAGYHAVLWDGRDGSGRRVSNGVYLYRMQAGNFAKTRKLVVVR